MQARIPPATISQALTTALTHPGLITPDDTAPIFYDLAFLTRRIAHLIELFPPSTLHTIAVKAKFVCRAGTLWDFWR